MILKVLLIGNDSLFGKCIEGLLSREHDLQLSSYPAEEAWNLVKVIKDAPPDIVIVLGPLQLIEVTRLWLVCQNQRHLRLLVVSKTENLVHIYEMSSVAITNRSDLAAVVRSGQVQFPLKTLGKP